MKKFCLLLLLIATGPKAETIFCSHHQVCNLVQSLYPTETTFQVAIELKGDPHHFHPTAKDVKALIDAPTLWIGPIELHPWIKKILTKRTRPFHQLNLPLDYQDRFNFNAETLSHFWLFPPLAQELFEQAKTILKKDLVFPSLPSVLEVNTLAPVLFVLTHDALAPYFNFLDLPYFALKTSHHHDSLSAKTLKELSETLKKYDPTQVFWLKEKDININWNQLKKLQQSEHRIIEIDTLGKIGTPWFRPLDEMNTKVMLALP